MADRNRRLTVAAVMMPLIFLFLAISASARAATITVNTLDGGSDSAPLCTLEDAVTAANEQAVVNGCAAGSGNDTIVFVVTGTIAISQGLFPTGTLSIIGPVTSPGITISGIGSPERIVDFSHTNLTLKNLTLADGSDLGITAVRFIRRGRQPATSKACTFVGNHFGRIMAFAGSGGAIFTVEGTTTIINSTFANTYGTFRADTF